jgi:solute carrier family 25 phosphate transporter 3
MFASQHPLTRPKSQPQAQIAVKHQPFSAWSAVEDIKKKTDNLSQEVRKNYEKAGEKAQARAGKIELYSPKYYAACTFGGLLACVSCV